MSLALAADMLMGSSIPATQGGVAWTVFRTHKPDLIGNVALRGDFNSKVDERTGYHTESMMTVPVKRTDGDPIGVMQVLNASVPFTERDLEVLEVLCAQAATGIEHARLVQEARKAEIVHVIGDIFPRHQEYVDAYLVGRLDTGADAQKTL